MLALAACENFASPPGAPPANDYGEIQGEVSPTGTSHCVVSGDDQQGFARETLIDLFVDQVSDDGVAVEGAEVSWQIVSNAGGGAVLGISTVIDSDRRMGGAVLNWRDTDDLATDQVATAGNGPAGGGTEAVMIVTDDVGSITVWWSATPELPGVCADDPIECWIGTTVALEEFPVVMPQTLDARVGEPGEDG